MAQPLQPLPLEALGWRPWEPPPPSAWQSWGRNALWFLVTAASVFFVGGGGANGFDPLEGFLLAASLLPILIAHEMGHYVACRLYGVDATLPYFIPLPIFSLVGTLGAFIRIRGPIPNRRALFDIGIAGPLAGFVVLLPILVASCFQAQVAPFQPRPGAIYLGEPLLFQWAMDLLRGPLPEGLTWAIDPMGMAAWFGLFMTGLNLFPIGQLDGGHVVYAWLGERARHVSRVASWVCLALVYFGLNWLVWSLLLRLLGRGHPSTLDDREGIGPGRKIVALIGALVFVVCFVPDPMHFSWKDFFLALPDVVHYLAGF